MAKGRRGYSTPVQAGSANADEENKRKRGTQKVLREMTVNMPDMGIPDGDQAKSGRAKQMMVKNSKLQRAAQKRVWGHGGGGNSKGKTSSVPPVGKGTPANTPKQNPEISRMLKTHKKMVGR
jgi:hypothetical protein